MPSDFDEVMAEGVAEALAVAGETVTIRTASVTAVVTPIAEDPAWSDTGGGARPKFRCSVEIATPAIAYSPALRIGEPVTASGRSLKIEAIESDATSIRLTCSADA